MVLSGPSFRLSPSQKGSLAMSAGIPRTIGAIGTSHEAGGDAVAGGTDETCWIDYMLAHLDDPNSGLNARVVQVSDEWNQSIGGSDYASIYGTQADAIVALQPDMCIVGAPVNSSPWGSSEASDANVLTYMQQLLSICAKLERAGIEPLITDPLSGSKPATDARISKITARWCELTGRRFLYVGWAGRRPQDGTTPAGAGFTHDGTHLNPAGAKRAGEEAARWLAGRPRFSPWLQVHRADEFSAAKLGGNFVSGGCGVNGAGTADFAAYSTSGSGSTNSYALATEFPGAWASITRNATSGEPSMYTGTPNFSGIGVTAGTTKLRVGYRLQATVESTGSMWGVNVQHVGVSTEYQSGTGMVKDIATPGACFVEDITPDTSSTAMNMFFRNFLQSATASGVVKFSGFGVTNLTEIDAFLRTNGLA